MQTPTSEVYKKFGLEPGTQDFIGHAMCLFLDDTYKDQPWSLAYKAMGLYSTSIARWGKSPYIYPLYGLGELPQGFARFVPLLFHFLLLSPLLKEKGVIWAFSSFFSTG